MIVATALASAAVVLTGPAVAPATVQGDLDAAVTAGWASGRSTPWHVVVW